MTTETKGRWEGGLGMGSVGRKTIIVDVRVNTGKTRMFLRG